MHFLKSILRKNRNKFLQDVPIKNIDYAKSNDTKKDNSPVWFHNFVGFHEFRDCYFGYYSKIDDIEHMYVALYCGYKDTPIEYEPSDLCIQNPYIIMFYGSDNSSFFIRQKTEFDVNKAFDFIRNTNSFLDVGVKFNLYSYNS